MLDPVVQRALQELTSRIGTGSGLTAPDDKAAAVGVLSSLKSVGKSFEPEAVAAWASLNGWTPKGVAQIRSVANDVLSGKSFGGSPAAWSTDLVEKLRTEAR